MTHVGLATNISQSITMFSIPGTLSCCFIAGVECTGIGSGVIEVTICDMLILLGSFELVTRPFDVNPDNDFVELCETRVGGLVAVFIEFK